MLDCGKDACVRHGPQITRQITTCWTGASTAGGRAMLWSWWRRSWGAIITSEHTSDIYS